VPAPQVEVVAALDADVALGVPGKAEEAGRDQAVFAHSLARDLGVAIDAQADLGRGQPCRGLGLDHAAAGCGQAGVALEGALDQRVQLGIAVMPPPVRGGPGARMRVGQAGQGHVLAYVHVTDAVRHTDAGAEHDGGRDDGEGTCEGGDVHSLAVSMASMLPRSFSVNWRY
jgi:hypothetical protein